MKPSLKKGILSVMLFSCFNVAAQEISVSTEGYKLARTTSNNGITKEEYVIEDEFGVTEKKLLFYKKENGDYLVAEEKERIVFEYKRTCKEGHVHTRKGKIYSCLFDNGIKLEDELKSEMIQFSIDAYFLDFINSFINSGCEGISIEEGTVLYLPGQTEKHIYGKPSEEETVFGAAEGFPINDRLYKMQRDGTLIPFMQRVNNLYMYANETDTISDITISNDSDGKRIVEINYVNGDLFRVGGEKPGIKIHRNGGLLVGSGNFDNIQLKYQDGSAFFFKGFRAPMISNERNDHGFLKETSIMYYDGFKYSHLCDKEIPMLSGVMKYPDGTSSEFFDGINLKEADAKWESQRKAKEQKEYDAMCRKYGKVNVDKWNRTKEFWVGMPVELMKEVASCEVKQQNASGTQYYIYNVMHQPHWSVWVKNGKITSIRVF